MRPFAATGSHLRAGTTLSDARWQAANRVVAPLPAKCPELNPQENVWQFLRDSWRSNRVFVNAEDLVDYCCDTWNRREAQPWRIMSVGLRIGPSVLIKGDW
jgi:hypothetical protein